MLVRSFKDINLTNLAEVGGKNSSLGEMFQKLNPIGINVPDGFATTSFAWQNFLKENNLEEKLKEILGSLDTQTFNNLNEVGQQARSLILSGNFSQELEREILSAYKTLCDQYGENVDVAVRSSATAEDLPSASFAGQHDSYLNISGDSDLLRACLNCYASLFTNRAIKYRYQNGFDHLNVALSVGVQKMVRSDKGCAGVCFTIDPESGSSNVILITGAWGLGENVVQGAVSPDEFFVFKPKLESASLPLINKKLGEKEQTMVYASGYEDEPIENVETPVEKRGKFVLSDEEVVMVAKWAKKIEDHYGKPMDIEWAKDGFTGEIFIVQARPETVHGQEKVFESHEYVLEEKGEVLTKGKGIGSKISSGVARILHSPKDAHLLKEGEVLITEITNPDWDPILKKAAAIVTNRGGRTSHAAIVAREMGDVAVVGTGNATELIKDGDHVTVSCEDGVNGIIYSGKLKYSEKSLDLKSIEKPETKAMFILGDPDKAFKLAQYPNDGVGLMRLELVINSSIKIHPMALVNYEHLKDLEAKKQIEEITQFYPDKKQYFIDKLSQAVGTIAAAFYPKDVIVRMSDFKTNEYANLLGGKEYEPGEENPMLGFRGASRYYSEEYKEGFALECLAMKNVRQKMGLSNVKLMIPFCRTVEEGKRVLEEMKKHGLHQGENNLEVYVMAEIPSNIMQAEEFAKVFDGFSIGSNDLTQLTLGIDRDSSTVSHLFNENDPSTKKMISMVVEAAHKTGKKIGLCGQAPSDFPEFAKFLVEQGINSISFNPDAIIRGMENMKSAERKRLVEV